MRPLRRFLSLGMRDVRSSPPPIPEDARWRVINRAHADAQKKRKDAKAANRKWPADELPLAPLKALKASPGSSAHWVAETREGALPPRGGEAHESDGASVPLVAEAPGVSEAEATEDRALKTAETAVAAVGVSASSEATMAEAGAPEATEAIVMAARLSVQEAEMKAAEASVARLVQGSPLLRESAREAEVYPISSDDTSRAREVVDAEDAGAVEQPAPVLDKRSSALVRARPEPRGWDHPQVLW
ncbi:uncharacterized protein [Miscanthus floridulus]|uniref:uncharacterized protein n=1 Tax=Miscanthus floridulus TaxID=154761 RepID=UPI0034577EA4